MAASWRPRGKQALKRLQSDEGVSLVEVLVGIAIAAGIVAVLGTAVYQFFTVTRWGNNRMLVAADHQTALLWLSRDSAEAESFVPGSGNDYGSFEWPGGDPYFLYRFDPSENTLVRDHFQGAALQSSRVVARNVAAQGDVTFSPAGRVVSVSITTTAGSVSESMDVTLTMRVP